MVFFICGACGGSFKRKQAEQHTFRCQNWSFSCLDCNKDFPGQSYVSHKQCITESEKYFGQHHVAKAGKDKNEVWMEKLKQHLGSITIKPYYSRFIERMLNYPSIPKKEAKFVNFLNTSMNIAHKQTVDELWKIVSGANQVTDAADKENCLTNGAAAADTATNGTSQKDDSAQNNDQSADNDDKKKKKKKKKSSSKDSNEEDNSAEEQEPKKTKKRKSPEESQDASNGDGSLECEEEGEQEEDVEKLSKSARRKKRKLAESSATEEPDMLVPIKQSMLAEGEKDFADFEDITVETVMAKSQFKWRSNIKTLLRAGPEEGVKLKKLLRKVEELHNNELHGSAQPLPTDTLNAILMKMLAKKPFIIVNNRAMISKGKNK